MSVIAATMLAEASEAGAAPSDWLIYGIATQFIAILSYWLASKAMAERGQSTMANAIKVWGMELLLFLVFAVVMGILIFAVLATSGKNHEPSGLGFAFLVIVGLVGTIWISASVPMRVYQMGCGATIVFLIITAVCSAIAGVVLQVAWPGSSRLDRSMQQWTERMKNGGKAPPPDPGRITSRPVWVPGVEALEAKAADQKRPIAERQEALKGIYLELEKVRVRYGTASGVEQLEYGHHKARYDELLAALRKEAAVRSGK